MAKMNCDFTIERKKIIEAMKQTEKWFSDMHDSLYDQHDKAAKKEGGFFCAILERGMGAHDRAWVQWGSFLQDSGVPVQIQREWRKEKP